MCNGSIALIQKKYIAICTTDPSLTGNVRCSTDPSQQIRILHGSMCCGSFPPRHAICSTDPSVAIQINCMGACSTDPSSLLMYEMYNGLIRSHNDRMWRRSGAVEMNERIRIKKIQLVNKLYDSE